jgi:hypothetical protein
MIRRVFVMELRDDARAEHVEALVKILEDAPRYIESMKTSRVRPNLSPQPHDLVWEDSFDDLEGFLAYRAHPYHCNLIDEFLASESPRRITVIRAQQWFLMDDDDSRSAVSHVPSERKPASLLARGSILPEGDTDPIAMLEEVWVKPGCIAEYLALYEAEYLPTLLERGMRLCGCWHSDARAGPDQEITMLWSIDGGWSAWDRIRALGRDDPTIHEWNEKAEKLRVDGRRRLLVPFTFANDPRHRD